MAGLAEGQQAFSNGDYGTAYQEMKPLADAGDPEAQVVLCFMHHDGLGRARKDAAVAFSYCSKAAQQQNEWGEYLTGVAYLEGDGIAQDYAQAIKWIELAAVRGFDPAQYTLGQLYIAGRGVQEDRRKGVEWLRRAASQGNKSAEFDLGLLEPNSMDIRTSPADTRKAAEAGYAGAQYIIGLWYKLGAPGYKRDNAEAFDWLARAARQGDSAAQTEVGKLYLRGEGVPRDTVKAHMWFNLAAAQGDKEARELRETAEETMSAAEISEAQGLAKNFKVTQEQDEAFP